MVDQTLVVMAGVTALIWVAAAAKHHRLRLALTHQQVPAPVLTALHITTAGLLLFTLSGLSDAAGALAVALLGLAALILLRRATHSPATTTALLALMLAAWMAAQSINANVPDLVTGALGWYRSSVMLVSLALALLLDRHCHRLRHLLLGALLGMVGVSLIVHVVAPGFEGGISRAAGGYTAQFGGQLRAQGIFPGPFHLAAGSSWLLVAGVLNFIKPERSPLLSVAMVLTGLWGLYEVNVRTSILVVAVGLAVLLISVAFSRRDGQRARDRAILLAVTVGTAVFVASLLTGTSSTSEQRSPVSPALQSLMTGELDTRATTRFETWQRSIDLITERPLAGWGSGAAGGTLQSRFGDNEHVTPHNMVLNYAVEGGLVSALLFLVIWWRLGLRVLRSRRLSSVAAFLVLTGFGVSGSPQEAVPVCVYLAMIAASPGPPGVWSRRRAVGLAPGGAVAEDGLAEGRVEPHRAGTSGRRIGA